MPAPKASPVLRTADIAEETAVRMPEAALADSTSAIAIEATSQSEKPVVPAKGSLLASLGRKLMPSRKTEAKAAAERTVSSLRSLYASRAHSVSGER